MLHEAMQEMLNQLKATLPRNTGYGWNIQKVHDVFYHLVRQIRESGRPSNADCQVGERGLKTWGKYDARHTRKGSVAVFSKSLCTRIYEESVIRRAQLGMDYESQKMRLCSNSHVADVDNLNMQKQSFMVGLPKYAVKLIEQTQPLTGTTGATVVNLVAEWAINTKRIGSVALPKQALENIERLYFSPDEDQSKYKHRKVNGFTEYIGNMFALS